MYGYNILMVMTRYVKEVGIVNGNECDGNSMWGWGFPLEGIYVPTLNCAWGYHIYKEAINWQRIE